MRFPDGSAIREFICIFLLIAAGSCVPKDPLVGPGTDDPCDVLAVFLTGNELGELKPCGCSGGQLGGLERRAAVFNTVPELNRMMIATGNLVRDQGRQNQIKFQIFVEAFALLDYDVVNLSPSDVEVARLVGVLEEPRPGFISAGGQDEGMTFEATKEYVLGGKPIRIAVASFDADSASVGDLDKLVVSDIATVRILIVNNCDGEQVDQIWQGGYADCLICPSESDEAILLSEPGQTPLMVSVGRLGKHVGRLVVRRADNERGFSLDFGQVDLDESLKPEPDLVELYRSYQQWVQEENLLAKHPKYSLDEGLSYLGSETCKLCHNYEYSMWSTKKHAHAYATLVEDHSHFDPECVVCHVVGMDYQSGFLTEQETPHLKDVGCENCHGPGSKHIENPEEIAPGEPKSACEDCHTPEHSAEFSGNEAEYLKKIVHWREPNSVANVK